MFVFYYWKGGKFVLYFILLNKLSKEYIRPLSLSLFSINIYKKIRQYITINKITTINVDLC